MKIFAHRGFAQDKADQNSISSLDLAFKNEFFGVEFDIWFIDGELVLCHDKPQSANNLARFQDYLKYGKKIKYWCDFKNMNQENAPEILQIIKENLVKAKIGQSNIYFAPFIPDLQKASPIYKEIRKVFSDAKIMALCENPGDLSKYKKDLESENISHLSAMHENIDESFVAIFQNFKIFAWTVNDLKRAKELENLGVKYLTSDIITPQKYAK